MVGEGDNVAYLTAFDIIMDNFPDNAETGRHSSGTGLHKIDFKGKLEYWADFQQNVRTFCSKVKWDKSLEPFAARLEGQEDIYFTEYFHCGAEIPSTDKNLAWPKEVIEAEKQAKDKRSIPDYALLLPRPRKAHALGEAKHPWSRKADLLVTNARRGDGNADDDLRRFLGNMPFMTTYKWTVFLQRKKVDGKWMLFYTDPISNKKRLEPSGDVSVRACMLYILDTVSHQESDWSLAHEEQEPLSEWAVI
ncbi:uncharacterized protein BDV14DRAFT_193929 [Aspergillus stella-maris]|uniref:uncharacterized protein n=1 Tax=Aspergillus stella-maris TaxID=1810926 RepID=UPI003CCD2AB5